MKIIETILITIVSGIIGGYISYYFSRKNEKYKFLQLQKQKAEVVARLFSKWIKYNAKEKEYLNKNELADYFEELNRMSLELSLWVKDEKLLENIMLRLQNDDNAKSIRDIMKDFRKMILDNENDTFNHESITIWPK